MTMNKPSAVFKKVRSLETTKIDYLDEKSKMHNDYHERKSQRKKEINQSAQNLTNYINKENNNQEAVGKIFAGGYFRTILAHRFGKAPESVKNDILNLELQSLITQAGVKHGAYRGHVGVHALISLSPEAEKKIAEAGGDIDRTLHRIVTKTMKAFNAKFHPGEKIGYAFSIHHDTDNRHAHIYLSNKTDRGSYIATSDGLKNKKDVKRKKERENILEYLRVTTDSFTNSAIEELEKNSEEKYNCGQRIEFLRSQLDGLCFGALMRSEARIQELISARRKAEDRLREEQFRHRKEMDYALFRNSIYRSQLDQYYRDLEANKDVSRYNIRELSDFYLNRIYKNEKNESDRNYLDYLKCNKTIVTTMMFNENIRHKLALSRINRDINDLNNSVKNQNKFSTRILNQIEKSSMASVSHSVIELAAKNAALEYAKSNDTDLAKDVYIKSMTSLSKSHKIEKYRNSNCVNSPKYKVIGISGNPYNPLSKSVISNDKMREILKRSSQLSWSIYDNKTKAEDISYKQSESNTKTIVVSQDINHKKDSSLDQNNTRKHGRGI
ncbi:MAG: hypothetical protein RL095_453 [Verrucomicrobiota bacterium]